jgi:uncharacterized membrane protein
MYDTHARTIVKAVTFRIQTIALHWVITYLFTGSASKSTTMVFTITTINMIYYWLQERWFARISYGWAGTDLKRRSLVKAVLYKTWSLAVSLIVGYIVLGNMGDAGLLTVIKQTIALADFYVFERVWNKITWGRTSEAQS